MGLGGWERMFTTEGTESHRDWEVRALWSSVYSVVKTDVGSGFSMAWKNFSMAWITFSMLWKNGGKVFHGVEVPDFYRRWRRWAQMEQPEDII
jgi:hypothetical protein